MSKRNFAKLIIFGAITGIAALFVHISFISVEEKIGNFVNLVFKLQSVDPKEYNSAMLIGSYITAVINTILIFYIYYNLSPIFNKYKKIYRILFIFLIICILKQTFRGGIMSLIFALSYAQQDGGFFMMIICAFLYMLQGLLLNLILSIGLVLTCPVKNTQK